jgi:outer membrane protein TolC
MRTAVRIAVATCVAWSARVGAEAPPPQPLPAPPPLTLKEAIALARAHHPNVEAARGDATATHGRQEQALARLLPFVQGGVTYQPTTPNLVVSPAESRTLFASSGRDTVIDTSGNPVVVTCRTPGTAGCEPITAPPNVWTLESFWMLNVGLAWTAWDWGRSIQGYRSARDLAAAADVGVRAASQDVALQVALAFYGVIAAEEQVAVAQDAVKNYGKHLEQTRALHDNGLRTGIDVATAESAEAQVEIALARARASAMGARAQLQVALGVDRWGGWRLLPEPAAFELQPDDDRNADAALGPLVDAAEARRPEVERVRLEVSAFGRAVAATRGSYLPQLTLSIGPSWAGMELGSLTPNLTAMIAIGYAAGGMSPLLVHGQTREAEGSLVAARAQQRATADAVRSETVTAQAALVAARDEIRFARRLVDAAARQRGLAEGRYTTGVGNVIELYDALLTDVNARSQFVQARLDLASARARLRHALGEEP